MKRTLTLFLAGISMVSATLAPTHFSAFSFAAIVVAPQPDCLPYEPAEVTLTGSVSIKTFPGPPNYTSIKEGDKPEQAWILRLAKPICVKADKQDEVNLAVDHVSLIQLVLRDKQFSQVRTLNKRGPVTLTGTLFHSITAHHHAKVLMWVTDIRGQ